RWLITFEHLLVIPESLLFLGDDLPQLIGLHMCPFDRDIIENHDIGLGDGPYGKFTMTRVPNLPDDQDVQGSIQPTRYLGGYNHTAARQAQDQVRLRPFPLQGVCQPGSGILTRGKCHTGKVNARLVPDKRAGGNRVTRDPASDTSPKCTSKSCLHRVPYGPYGYAG